MKLFLLCSNCLSSKDDPSIKRNTHGNQEDAQEFRVFSHSELKTACNSFRNSEKIGEGGFGSVYKGRLRDGTNVGIKVLEIEIESMKGERQFVSELAILSTIRHENLVTLRGCCVNGAERYLVYDYMANNSLSHTFLGSEQNRAKFSWTRRRRVTLGIARGLAYLHEELQPHIIHRDIKGSNILLDENFTPKICDFGLSKVFRSKTSHISTRVAGTIGYLAPEYAISGHLSRKSDVYSFGVLLLEIVSGKPILDFNIEIGEQYLVDKAFQMYKSNTLLEMVDPVLKGDFPEQEALCYLKVGLLCVQETSKRRPRMSSVVSILCDEIDISNFSISHPGILDDLMDVKTGGQEKSPASFFSKGSTSMSTNSPQSGFLND